MISKKLVAQVIGLLISFYSFANDYPVTVRGRVKACDRTGDVLRKFPLAGARVELVDSDADGSQLFDDVMGTAIVNADGSFEVSGTGGDPGDYSWSRPDVYIRFVFNYNNKVRLTDELNRTRYASTPEHDHDNFEGTLDIGLWTLESDLSPGESSEAAVWFEVCRAWDDYVSIMGEEPKPGYCDVEYWSAIYAGTPWTSENTIHWPIHYPSTSAKHEFAHLIRHSFDGDRNHFNWDVTRFRYARYHSQCAEDCNNWSTESKEMNEAYAFNEGWAEFWAWEYHCSMNLSSQCEGGVAFTLKDIEDSLLNHMQQPRALMCRVLKNNPGSIHSIGDFIIKLNELTGKTLYAAQLRKDIRTKIVSTYDKPGIPTQVLTGYHQKKMEEVNSALAAVNGKLDRKSRIISRYPCKNCNTEADNTLKSSGLNAERKLLMLQQEMIQRNSEMNPDELNKKRSDNSLDTYMNDLRSNYSSRLGDIIEQAYNEAIAKLQSSSANDANAAAMAADLQSKRSPQRGDRGNREIKIFTYSVNVPVAISRDVQ